MVFELDVSCTTQAIFLFYAVQRLFYFLFDNYLILILGKKIGDKAKSDYGLIPYQLPKRKPMKNSNILIGTRLLNLQASSKKED